MGTATLDTLWGAMGIGRDGFMRRLTADEKATGQLTFADGTGVRFSAIDLPPTTVDLHHGVIWSYLSGNGPFGPVRACTATGQGVEGALVIDLDPEPVVQENGATV